MWCLIPYWQPRGLSRRSIGYDRAAADEETAELREFFLEFGIDVKQNAGRETLMHAAAAGGETEILRMLIRRGIDCEARDLDGKTPLHSAYEHRRNSCVEYLLDVGADFESADIFGETLLHKAVRFHDPVMVKKLLGRGADPNRPDADGKTTLHKAAENGRFH